MANDQVNANINAVVIVVWSVPSSSQKMIKLQETVSEKIRVAQKKMVSLKQTSSLDTIVGVRAGQR